MVHDVYFEIFLLSEQDILQFKHLKCPVCLKVFLKVFI